ncbi:SEFIR domain-containing protein [Mucilaginibacter sp. HD30]
MKYRIPLPGLVCICMVTPCCGSRLILPEKEAPVQGLSIFIFFQFNIFIIHYVKAAFSADQTLSMNNFYHISSNNSPTDSSNPFQLSDLGERRPSITIGKTTRDGYGGRGSKSHTYYTATTPADYDRQFVNKIIKYQPPYEVDQLLNYHFDYYIKRFPAQAETFRKHIKYVIIPLIEKTEKNPVSLELLREWLATNIGRSLENYRLHNIVQQPSTQAKQTLNTTSMSEVFISYSWDSQEHEQKVLEFTEHLRKKGFDARLDKMLSQQETATNFVKMMHKAMHEHLKVIVVLSKGYKIKAETFSGGVGEEYQLLLNDIKDHPRKYILVSFQGRSPDIIPFGLQGRDITDLSANGGEEQLFRKLMDKDAYEFSPVASQKPILEPVKIGDFQAGKQHLPLTIETPEVVKGDTSSMGGQYKWVEFELFLKFKNSGSKTIEGLAFSLKIKQQLAPEYSGQQAAEGYFTFTDNISAKIYPNQTVKSQGYKIKIAGYSLNQILGTFVTIEIFSDHGTETKQLPVEELFKLNPANQQYKEPSPLIKDLFIERWN